MNFLKINNQISWKKINRTIEILSVLFLCSNNPKCCDVHYFIYELPDDGNENIYIHQRNHKLVDSKVWSFLLRYRAH